MSEKQRWGKEVHLGDAVTAHQAEWCCDGVLRSRAVLSRCSRRQWEKRQPGAERVKPWLKWAMAHFPHETRDSQFHHLSDNLMQSTACSVPFLCSVRANALLLMLWFSGCWSPRTTHSWHWGLHQCHRLQHNCSIYCFSQKVPAGKISVKKHSVKMLPALLN